MESRCRLDVADKAAQPAVVKESKLRGGIDLSGLETQQVQSAVLHSYHQHMPPLAGTHQMLALHVAGQLHLQLAPAG